ncbi:hypothetical protein ACFPN2_25230 [Steroidobacter flavus]|uniref:Uncharacterized protein n=1 Tax=Steroidobacter flavus TaxID=1842136 RepID=A0ABV8SXV1_9GAMM
MAEMIENANALARQLAEIDARTDPKVTSFPSGAFILDVTIGGGRYAFEYLPSKNGFGVSRIDSATFGWEGFESSFEDFDSAKKYILNLLTAASRPV